MLQKVVDPMTETLKLADLLNLGATATILLIVLKVVKTEGLKLLEQQKADHKEEKMELTKFIKEMQLADQRREDEIRKESIKREETLRSEAKEREEIIRTEANKREDRLLEHLDQTNKTHDRQTEILIAMREDFKTELSKVANRLQELGRTPN